ncbi:MAG: hypothetical protein H8E57_01340 [Candidatus Cloacimonetes bacterium]|nr:hypothetical protein [Candidatus Cloacimonadota bacterium]
MASRNVSVDIFKGQPEKALDLGDNIVEKHEEDPVASPLGQVVDMTVMRDNISSAKGKREQAKALHRQAEMLNEEANNLLGIEVGQTSFTEGTIYNSLTKIRDLLLVLNKGHEEALNAWGFDVVVKGSSPSQPQNPEE